MASKSFIIIHPVVRKMLYFDKILSKHVPREGLRMAVTSNPYSRSTPLSRKLPPHLSVPFTRLVRPRRSNITCHVVRCVPFLNQRRVKLENSNVISLFCHLRVSLFVRTLIRQAYANCYSPVWNLFVAVSGRIGDDTRYGSVTPK